MNSHPVIMKHQTDIPVAPEQEQLVCVRCGFCCDGTLFMHAHLNEGERGNIPEKIEKASFTEAGKDYFRLPCQYFSGKCTIYDRKRAYVCGSYRCQLLKDMEEGKISIDEAYKTVRQALLIRKSIVSDFRRVTGTRKKMFFRQMLIELGKLQKTIFPDQSNSADLEILIARCNIYEALLIRHFRSVDEFGKMVMK